MIKTARDFELPDVEQNLAQLRIEINLPSSLLEWIDNHGQGMMRKRKKAWEGKRREEGQGGNRCAKC